MTGGSLRLIWGVDNSEFVALGALISGVRINVESCEIWSMEILEERR